MTEGLKIFSSILCFISVVLSIYICFTADSEIKRIICGVSNSFKRRDFDDFISHTMISLIIIVLWSALSIFMLIPILSVPVVLIEIIYLWMTNANKKVKNSELVETFSNTTWGNICAGGVLFNEVKSKINKCSESKLSIGSTVSVYRDYLINILKESCELKNIQPYLREDDKWVFANMDKKYVDKFNEILKEVDKNVSMIYDEIQQKEQEMFENEKSEIEANLDNHIKMFKSMGEDLKKWRKL